MGIFFKAEREVRQRIRDYLDLVDACMEQYRRGIEFHLQPDGGGVPPDRGETGRLESRADELRRDIEMTLYGRALMPDARGDILMILEAVDTVPGAAETVLSIVELEQVVIPPHLRDRFRALVDRTHVVYRLLRKSVDTLFTRPRETPHIVKEVDIGETEADRVEKDLIAAIFSSDIDKADRILLKDVAVMIGNIADRAENAADRMGIIAVKRRI